VNQPFKFTTITEGPTGAQYRSRRAIDAFDYSEARMLIENLGYRPEVTTSGELIWTLRYSHLTKREATK
jgi:hypothetical protein